MGNAWIDVFDFTDLVPYTHPSAAWSDHASAIALSWPDAARPGLQRLHALAGWGGTRVTDTLLGWSLSVDGSPRALSVARRAFGPDRVVEVDTAEGLPAETLTLEATAAFPARNVVAVQVVLANRGTTPLDAGLSFDWPGRGVPPDWTGPFPVGHAVSLEDEEEGSWATLFAPREHGRGVPWVETFVAGMAEGATIELVCLADLVPWTVRLGAGEQVGRTVLLCFGFTRGRARAARREALDRLRSGWSADMETARWRGVVRQSAELPARRAGDERVRRLYAHAVTGLHGLFVRGDGGYTGALRVPWTTRDTLALAFFWDTAFSCMGACEVDPVLGEEAIECFVDNAGPRGSMPGTLCDTHRAGEGQAPVMGLAAWQVFRAGGNREWLARVFPTLARYTTYWMRYHASARGLPVYFNAGQIGDNDARFDGVHGREQMNEPLAGFEPPDLAAFFVVEMRCLSRMARALRRPGEAGDWARRADELAARIVEVFWFPGEAMFYDVKEGTHEPYSRTSGPTMFLPLWAGVPLPRGDVQRVIEGHMLNPRESWQEVPFPSLSYDDPRHDPTGYWRGRCWPHIGFLMAQTLWRHGYRAEAEQAAERLLRLYLSSPWLHENYGSGDGAPVGFPEYNWAHATAIQLLLDRYREQCWETD